MCFVFLVQEELGTEDSLETVQKLMPKRVKKRRQIETEDGVSLTL